MIQKYWFKKDILCSGPGETLGWFQVGGADSPGLHFFGGIPIEASLARRASNLLFSLVKKLERISWRFVSRMSWVGGTNVVSLKICCLLPQGDRNSLTVWTWIEDSSSVRNEIPILHFTVVWLGEGHVCPRFCQLLSNLGVAASVVSKLAWAPAECVSLSFCALIMFSLRSGLWHGYIEGCQVKYRLFISTS